MLLNLLFIKKKKICCAQFSMYITTGFCFVAGGRFGRGRELLFIVFTNSILSAYPFKFSSSSYTMYYQFWYNYIYINIKLYLKGYLKPIHGSAGAWYTVKWTQHWTATHLGQALLWKCWDPVKVSWTWSTFQPTWELDSHLSKECTGRYKNIYFFKQCDLKFQDCSR